jgi:hypothetical protein
MAVLFDGTYLDLANFVLIDREIDDAKAIRPTGELRVEEAQG